jgi:zinc protease
MEMAFSEKEKTESRNFAREYVSNYLNGEAMPGIEYEYNLAKKFVEGIGLEEVNHFADNWISDGKNCIVLITAPEKESTVMPAEETLKNAIKSMSSLELTAYKDNVIDKPLLATIPSGSKVKFSKKIEEFNITEWNLENGIKIFAKPTDFKNDQILFSSYSWGGWSVYPEKDFMNAANADRIIDESGLGEFDANSLEKVLSGKIVSCTPYISELQQGLQGGCSPNDLETLMQMIYMYHTSPCKDNNAFTSWMEKQKGVLQNKNADPQSVFSDTISYVMSGYNERYKPRTVERLKEINLQRSYEIYNERFGNANGSVYFFVGNFNLDTLKNNVEKYLGGLKSSTDRKRWEDIGASPPKGKVEKTVRMGEEPKSTVMLRFNLPFEFNRNNRNEVNALNKLVSIRLREVLREEKSGVYGVSFSSNPQHYPESKLEHVVYFSCSPDNVESLITAALDVINEVKTKGCDEKNLVKIKETAIRERETFMQENSFWLSTMSSNNQNGEDITEISKFKGWVSGLKTDDLKKFANKYLLTDNYARFVLLPK